MFYTPCAAIANILAPLFIRVLQSELSFNNNIHTQYFWLSQIKTIVLRSGMKMKMREVIKNDEFKIILLTMSIQVSVRKIKIKMPATKVNLSQMVDLAVVTPRIGAVNSNVLHTLLHAMLRQLNIVDVQAETNLSAQIKTIHCFTKWDENERSD
jgi:agmatine/peptidylarginine deiminase